MIRKLAVTAVLAVALSGCNIASQLSSGSSSIETVLTQLGNTLVSDLQSQKAVALAATPPDVDGAACAGALPDPTKPGDTGTGALAVAAAIQRVATATVGQKPGALTVAEIASLYQPGSDQFNWSVKTLETACIAKVHDVNQAINSTAGIIAALPSILALAAAPAGM